MQPRCEEQGSGIRTSLGCLDVSGLYQSGQITKCGHGARRMVTIAEYSILLRATSTDS